MIRYKAEFTDGTEFSLFGEDYFNDKPTFNRHHQTNVVDFCVFVAEKGFPIRIKDIYLGESLGFQNIESFNFWFQRHQSIDFDFGFSGLVSLADIENECIKRIDDIINFLIIELKELLSIKEFNPWRLDGGYKSLERTCRVSIASLESCNARLNFSSYKLNVIKEIFIVPMNKIDNLSLISYSKTHSDIVPEILIELCAKNLERLKKLKLQIEK